MKNFVLFLIILGGAQIKAQVGINTNNPNTATMLDIVSDSKGILIPRLTDAQRDASLADNNPTTVPPAGVVNTNLTAGTLIFNTTENRFEFWDGLLWKQLFVATSSQAGNDGVVKINSGASNTKPTYNLVKENNSYGPEQQVIYTTPLSFAAFPTTSWPETTVPFPGTTSNIYIGTTNATQRWIENNIDGQVHVWRLIIKVTAGASSLGSLKATFRNPNTSFEVSGISLLPAGSQASKVLTFYFYTIADSDSTSPGRGYQLFLQADVNCTVEVDSFTRVSLFKD